MTRDAQLNAVEEHIYKSYWDDGLVDLLVGICILLLGVVWLSDLIALGAVIPLILLPFWHVGRERITIPRIGYVRFSLERTERTRLGLNVAMLTGLGLLTLFGAAFAIAYGTNRIPQADSIIWVAGLPSFIVAAALIIAWRWFGIPRMASYAGILAVVGVVGAGFGIEPGWQLLAAGSLIAVVGSVVLTRFILHNPPVGVRDGNTG